MGRVLLGAGLTVAEVPEPTCGPGWRLVAEPDGQRCAAAGGLVGGESGCRGSANLDCLCSRAGTGCIFVSQCDCICPVAAVSFGRVKGGGAGAVAEIPGYRRWHRGRGICERNGGIDAGQSGTGNEGVAVAQRDSLFDRAAATQAAGYLKGHIVVARGGKSDIGRTGVIGSGRAGAVGEAPVVGEVTRPGSLVDKIEHKGGGAGGGGLVPGEIGLYAVYYANVAVLGIKIGAAPGICDFQSDVIISCGAIGMGWVLLIGTCAVPKLPCPGSNGALSRGRLIGELYVVGDAGELQVGGKIRCRVWVDRYITRFTYGVGTAPVPGDECNRIGARSIIGNIGVLDGRSHTVAEIPLPIER